MKRKLRLLAWNDSPLSITGFGVVAKNILNRIYDTGEFDLACIGINYIEEHAEKAFESRAESIPYKVFIGQDMQRDQNGNFIAGDRMGREKAINFLKSGQVDVFFMMRDLWDMCVPQIPGRPWMASYFPLHIQLAKEAGRNFRTLAHFPLEYQLDPNWRGILDQIDYGYCFTAGGMDQLKLWERNIKWAPQGADDKVFRPLPPKNWGAAQIIHPNGIIEHTQIQDKMDFRKRKMQLDDPNAFVVLNVNRNQPRKDIRATFKAFRKFKEMVQGTGAKRRPILWSHMRPDDAFGDARQMAREEGLIVDHDVVFPPYFNVGVGWTEQELNMLYNAADIFVSTSVAEGFGLTPVEALMAGLPVLVPGHTGHLQTVTRAGMPLVATDQPEIRQQISNSPITPTNVTDMAQKLFEHYNDPSKLNNILKKTHKQFTNYFNWDTIFKNYWAPALETIQRDLYGTEERQKKNSGRFLYVCEEAFGDILGASGAIKSLKAEHPDVPIDFLCKQRFNDVLQGNKNIDKILDWDINKIFDYPKEQVFYPHAKIRHGGWAFGTTHLLDLQAEMMGLRASDPEIVEEPFDLLLDDFLANQDDETWPIITIHTSSQGGKMITPEKWAAIIYHIGAKHPELRFVQIGGPSDFPVTGAIDMRFEPGKDEPLSYRKMAYLQSKAFCHIGIDSGPAHCASTVDTPSIIFWGWTNPYTCKPKKHSINVVPHYATVCPKMGPCHGVQPACGVNQYDQVEAMKAPCVQSLQVSPAIDLILEALDGKTLSDAKDAMKLRAKKIKNIYGLPPAPQAPVSIQAKNKVNTIGAAPDFTKLIKKQVTNA